MDFLFNSIFLEHDTGTHPENKNRLTAFGQLQEYPVDFTETALTLVHPLDYITFVRDCAAKSIPLDNDTVTSPRSFAAAVAAVNLTITASQQHQFALVRPPGHHAHAKHGRGFCLFNNIAVAVEKLVKQNKKVAIIDFDGHFGDGTAAYFSTSNQVLYCSTHQGDAYPGGGSVDNIGSENGLGYTVNIPLPSESGDDVFHTAITWLLPIVEQFKPDVIAVSAGFDGHHSDPLLTLHLTTNSYYFIGQQLFRTGVPLFATLEGGYNTHTLPACAYSFLQGVNDESHSYQEPTSESRIPIIENARMTLDNLENNLQPYWNFKK